MPYRSTWLLLSSVANLSPSGVTSDRCLCLQLVSILYRGVAESGYETISESLEALSKIQRNHSVIQQRPLPTCLQFVAMPNPGVTLRVPQNVYDALPTDAEARSAWLMEAITSKLHPPEPEDELAKVKQQLQSLDRVVQAMQKHFLVQ